MKPKSLLILFLLATGLMTYVYYGIQKPSEEIEEKGKPEDRLAPGDLAKLEWIQIKTASLTLTLERQNQSWRISAPVSDIASQSKVESLIAALEKLRKTKVLYTPQELSGLSGKRAQFGLEKPRVQLTYKLSNLSHNVEVSLGEANPSATATFVETKTHGLVLATMDIDYLVNQTINEFREMRLTTVPSSDFVEVSLENAHGKIKFIKENDQWKLADRTLPIDAEIVRNFVDKIGFVRATEFVDKIPTSAGKPVARLIVGFQKDSRDLRTTPNDKRPEGLEFAFYHEAVKAPKGSKDKPEDLYYIESDKAGLAKTNSYHFENFQKKVQDFVKKTFDDFLLASLRSASIRSKTENFEIVHHIDEGSYQTKGEYLDKDKTEALFNQIRNLKADSFVGRAKHLPAQADLMVTLDLGDRKQDYAFKTSKTGLQFWTKRNDDILEYKASLKGLILEDFTRAHLKPSEKPEEKAEEKAKETVKP